MTISGRALGLVLVLAGCSSADPEGLYGAASARGGESGETDSGVSGAPAAAGGRFGLAVEDSGAPTSGDATASGGAPGQGGGRAAGGAVSTGGVIGAAATGSGGALSTGGAAAAGGSPSAGGMATGGHATGGAASSGGAVGTGGAPVCDPAVQCEARRCFGIVACGNGATLDCSIAVHCGKTEYCDKNTYTGTCRSFFDGLDCNGSGSGPIHVCAISGVTGACNDCQRAPTAPQCKLTTTPDSWRCLAE